MGKIEDQREVREDQRKKRKSCMILDLIFKLEQGSILASQALTYNLPNTTKQTGVCTPNTGLQYPRNDGEGS